MRLNFPASYSSVEVKRPHSREVHGWVARAKVTRFTSGSGRTGRMLLKSFKAVGSLESGSNVRAWLLTIARNTWLDRVRSHAHRRETPPAEGINPSRRVVIPHPGSSGR